MEFLRQLIEIHAKISLAMIWNPYGIYGIPTEPLWNLYGIPLETLWNTEGTQRNTPGKSEGKPGENQRKASGTPSTAPLREGAGGWVVLGPPWFLNWIVEGLSAGYPEYSNTR